MNKMASVCAFLVLALVAVSTAGEVTSATVEVSASAREPHIRIGECSLTPAQRAALDPRLSNKWEPGTDRGRPFGPRCELECDACWDVEGETCGDDYVDSYNGGCNSSPEAFWSVSPAWGPVTICGQGGNYEYLGSTYRDTDWYELTFTESREITVTCTAEFPIRLYLIDGATGCSGYTIVAQTFAEECLEASITYTVTPGTWWVWVGCSEWTDWPCDSDYHLTIYGYDFPCVLDCPGGVPVEGEPPLDLGIADAYNGGCNSAPVVFQPLEPYDGTAIRCGVGGYFDYLGGCIRDTDWYEMELDAPREVTVCVAGEAPMQLMFVTPDPDCSNVIFDDYVYADQCEEGCITQVLGPGVHWVFIAPQFVSYVRPDARYIFSVEGYTTAVETRSWGLIKNLYR